MKNWASIIIFVVFALGIALTPTFINAFQTSVYLPSYDSGYEITAYDVDIDVRNDGSFLVKEKITAHFNESSHGIERWLPIKQTSTYSNAKGKVVSKNFRAKISNVRYDMGQSSSGTRLVDKFSESGYYFLQMGSDTWMLPGVDKTYAFSYVYDFGNDRDTSMDMLYYNIIGTGWDTRINDVKFSITLPKTVSQDGIEFYVGKYGESTTNSNRVTSSFAANEDGSCTISGSVDFLDYGEAVTIFKALDEGYFKYSRSYIFDIAFLVGTLLLVGLLIALFLMRRRKDPIVEVVEFKAPDDVTSAEAGLINDGKLTGDDLSSLIVFWASKGFVKIKQEDKKIKIVKVATPEQLEGKMKDHEKILFDDMFRGGRTEVDSKNIDLSADTGLRCQKSVKSSCEQYFDRRADKWYVALLVCSALLFLLFAIKNGYQAVLMGVLLVIDVILPIITCFGIAFIPSLFKYRDKCKKWVFITLLVVDLLAIFAPIIAQMVLAEAFCDAFGARFYIIIVAMLLVAIYPFLERYSAKGKELLGRIRGLKNYILVAEKDKMEMLVKDDPSLFYQVLPFAYVLGVSDVFMKKFEDVQIVQPANNPTFLDTWVSFVVIDNCMHSVSNSVTQSIAAARAVRVGHSIGGFTGHIGGGGFSGGGHGGGGGGRW